MLVFMSKDFTDLMKFYINCNQIILMLIRHFLVENKSEFSSEDHSKKERGEVIEAIVVVTKQ